MRRPRYDLALLHRPADLRGGAVDRHHPDRRHRAAVAADRAVSAHHAAGRVRCRSAIPGPAPRSWPTRSRRPSSSRSTASRACCTCRRRSGNDGSYTLTVTFDLGTDLNTALVMVQNRVALAMPQLPTAVQNQGITIRKKTPDILMIVNFYLAGRPLRRHLPEQLRHDQRPGRTAARGRRVGHQLPGPARLQHPRLARPAEAGVAQHDRHRRGRTPSAARTSMRRPGRSASRRPPRTRPFSCRSTRWAGSPTRSSSATSSSRSAERLAGLAPPPCARSASPRQRLRPCRPPAAVGQRRSTQRQTTGQRAEHRPTAAARPRDQHRRHDPTGGSTTRAVRIDGSATAAPAAARHRRRRHQRRRSTGGRRRHDRRRQSPAAADRHDRRHARDRRHRSSGGDRRPTAAAPGRPSAEHRPARATWPASSWARRTTTRPAPSTASRPSASASTSCPAPTRSTWPTACRAKMEELKTRFPDGVDYADRLRHHAVHPRVGRRRGPDAARGGRAGRPSWCWSSCRTGGRC